MDASRSALPYPLPAGWQLSAARTPRWLPVAIFGLFAVGLAAASVAALLRGDAGGAVLLLLPAAAIGLVLGVVYETSGGQRQEAELLNAVVLEKAMVRPPDSWIHFFRESGPGRAQAWGFSAVGIGGSTMLAWAAALVIWGGRASPWLLLLVIPLLLGALVVALAGVIAIVLRHRHASFGRRPIGLSVGRSGIVRYYLDGVDVFAWDDVREITAHAVAVDAQTKDFTAEIEIITDRTHRFSISAYRAHPWLILTALRFWRDRAGKRDELGTTFAQRRIDGWSAAIAARALARGDVPARG